MIVDVEAVAHGGHCVARVDGRVVFVRHALPGERVRVVVTERNRGYWRADAVEILTSSPERVNPPCSYAGVCGGCDLQHVSQAGQLDWKTRVLREQLTRLGGLDDSQVADVTVRAPGRKTSWLAHADAVRRRRAGPCRTASTPQRRGDPDRPVRYSDRRGRRRRRFEKIVAGTRRRERC